MKTLELIEANKLIAGFMGLKPAFMLGKYRYSDSPFFYSSNDTEEQTMQDIAKYVKYHCSWDWLMPVIQKIQDLGYPALDADYTKIDELHANVVDFINWYYEQ
jgi:hypothetical protein